jgi:hypothetical protein
MERDHQLAGDPCGEAGRDKVAGRLSNPARQEFSILRKMRTTTVSPLRKSPSAHGDANLAAVVFGQTLSGKTCSADQVRQIGPGSLWLLHM